jgi:hypothetical protein
MRAENHEAEAIRQVAQRLRTAYRDTRTPAEIDGAIADAHRRFEGRPVRDFVPILVERAARARLEGRRRTAVGV